MIGERFRLLREERGYTLRDVETITGISNAYLSQIERGKRKGMTIATFKSLCDIYGADPTTILTHQSTDEWNEWRNL